MNSTPLYPVFKLLLPFSLGIVLWWYIGESLKLPLFLLLALIPFFYYYYQSALKVHWLRNTLAVCCLLSVSWMGYQITAHYASPLPNNSKVLVQAHGKVLEMSGTARQQRATVQVSQATSTFHHNLSLGKIYVNFSKSIEVPFVGDQIAVKGMVQRIPNPKNPGGFDFNQYARRHNIHNQLYAEDWYRTAESPFFQTVRSTRDQLTDLIKQYAPQTASVSLAMLMGDKSSLSDEEVQAFKTSGLMHLLVVSGLHAGLFYAILWLLFNRTIPTFRFKKGFITGLALMGMWIFIILAGYQPSAVRAGLMISLYGIGRLIQRRSSGLNVLGGAALLMLLFRPHLLFQLSFQFSFMALLGIVVLFPELRKRTKKFSLSWMNKLVDGVLITVSTQLTLMPLLLFYFNEYPIYSLIGAIPSIILVPFIMASGILMIVTGLLIPVLAVWIGQVHEFTFQILLEFTELIEGLSGNLMEVQYFNLWQVVLWFVILALGYLIWVKRSRAKVIAFFIANLVFIGTVSSIQNDHHQNGLITIYTQPSSLFIDVFMHGTCYEWTPNLEQNSYFQSQRSNWRRQHRCTTIIPIPSNDTSKVVCWNDQILQVNNIKVGLYDENRVPAMVPSLDFLIINTNRIAANESFDFHAGKVILPAFISKENRNRIERYCQERGIPIHNLYTDGAFIQKFNI